MKHKKLIVLITAVVLLISSIGIYGKSTFFSPVKGEVTTILSFNYDGVDQGLNPHGGSFDIQRVKDTPVLEATIKELGLAEEGITADILSRHLSLKPYVPKDILERILPKAAGSGVAQVQDIEGMSYHPTQYSIVLDRTAELGLSVKEGGAVLESLIKHYQAYFIERYKDTQSLEVAITEIDPSRYDYSEYILLAEGQLEIMHEYLLAKEQIARDFLSATTGMTYSDLIAQVELLQHIELSNVKALVDTFMVTKDENELQSVYENRIFKLQRELEQLGKEKESITKALNEYKKDPTVILDNGVTVSEPYVDQEREVPLYEDLVASSIDIETKWNQVNYQIKYYQDLLKKIYASTTNASATTAYEEEVEETTSYIAEQINTLVSLIVQTTDEYYEEEAFAGSVTRTAPITYRSAFKLGLIKNTVLIGVITGFGLIFAIIFAIILELVNPKRSAKQLVQEARAKVKKKTDKKPVK